MQLIVILALLFAMLVAVVAVQNTTPVTLRVLTLEVRDIAVSVLALASMAVGAILTAMFSVAGWLGRARAIRQRDEKIARLEAELAPLRAGALPATVAPAADSILALPTKRPPQEAPEALGGAGSSSSPTSGSG